MWTVDRTQEKWFFRYVLVRSMLGLRARKLEASRDLVRVACWQFGEPMNWTTFCCASCGGVSAGRLKHGSTGFSRNCPSDGVWIYARTHIPNFGKNVLGVACRGAARVNDSSWQSICQRIIVRLHGRCPLHRFFWLGYSRKSKTDDTLLALIAQ